MRTISDLCSRTTINGGGGRERGEGLRHNGVCNYRKTGNFRVVQFSRNFAVSINPRKLKSAKYFPFFFFFFF